MQKRLLNKRTPWAFYPFVKLIHLLNRLLLQLDYFQIISHAHMSETRINLWNSATVILISLVTTAIAEGRPGLTRRELLPDLQQAGVQRPLERDRGDAEEDRRDQG